MKIFYEERVNELRLFNPEKSEGKYVKSLQMHENCFKEDRNTFKDDVVKKFESEIRKNP